MRRSLRAPDEESWEPTPGLPLAISPHLPPLAPSSRTSSLSSDTFSSCRDFRVAPASLCRFPRKFPSAPDRLPLLYSFL
ncbi:hypothetical protein VTO73DRAFT_384 [Trametes versicolor]